MKSKRILFLIIFSQFAGTSLWFAGNAIMPDLILEMGLKASDISSITSAVQAGFIIGTLIFAITAVADRFSPSKVFFACSIVGAVFNASIYWLPKDLTSVVITRFLTGIMLAGIYPIGMKIAADWFKDELGKAIGYLVGALVLGTAFPSLIRALGSQLEWSMVLGFVSVLVCLGGFLVLLFIKDGPYRRPMSKFDPRAITTLFKSSGYRSASLGYFGHQWELYTFWAFVPTLLRHHENGDSLNVSLWTFLIIGSGALGSSFGGILSRSRGSAFVAWVNLLGSAFCIILFPIFIQLPLSVFLCYLLVWGWLVVGDSPQFSALAAMTTSKDQVGSGLTFMNCIGYTVSIVSIYTLNYLMDYFDLTYAILFLLPGPLLALIAIYPLKQQQL